MNFFDHIQKKGVGAIRAQKPQIRQVKCKPTVKPSPRPLPKPSRIPPEPVSAARRSASSASTPSADVKSRPSKAISRKRPASEPTLCSSSDDSDTDSAMDLRITKRVKASASVEVDLKRRVRDVDAFSDKVVSFDMVHAADITSPAKTTERFQPAFKDEGEPATLFFRYPGALQKEKYRLVVPVENDGFKPLDDLVQVIEIISQNYLPDRYVDLFQDDSKGILRCLRRALTQGSLPDFMAAMKRYDESIKKLRMDGSIARHLDSQHALSLPLVERILTQVYSRTVSPRVNTLRQYENGSDNIYGELLPRLVSTMFAETGLKSDHVFVDLGSGVGNVVLQAALEIGCESWGCEVMPNACDLAELQQKEFETRCRLWGIAPGKTHLIRGDFLESDAIGKALQEADVILINNQAFTPELNNKLVNYFLDLKEGCRIISLKSFVPPGHRIRTRNLDSPINLLSVKQKQYWSDSVSWTNAGGTYCIATKDSSRLKAFAQGSP